MVQIQLDLFNELSEIEIVKKELEDVRTRSENVRRGLFARHNELAKMYIELKERCDTIEAKIYTK